MAIHNFTPFTIRFVDYSGKLVEELYPEKNDVSVGVCSTLKGTLDKVPVVKQYPMTTMGLPEYKAGEFYVVAPLVIDAARNEGRTLNDLLRIPYSSRINRVVECKHLEFAV